MAILQKPASNGIDLFELDRENLPPAGTFAARILDIQDRMGVERTKYQSQETETVDLTAFLFGFTAPDGTKWRIDTRPMKISGHPKSALYKFLTGLMGKAPEYGWDYMALKGTGCLLTIAHMVSQQGNPYASITAAVPLPTGFGFGGRKEAVRKPPEIRLADDDEGEDDGVPF